MSNNNTVQKNVYKVGDRVASNIMGYYYGLPGTIKKHAQLQFGQERFVVVLDTGTELVLDADQITLIEN